MGKSCISLTYLRVPQVDMAMSHLHVLSALPIEVIEKIILEAWFLPLSTDDRITLMTSSTLVNKAWSSIFARISFKDVHIPCHSYLRVYFGITRKTSFYNTAESPQELACRSIHLRIENTPVHPRPCTPGFTAPLAHQRTDVPMGYVLVMLVWTLHIYPRGFPNLRTLSLELVNLECDNIFANYRFFQFPHQVTDLELAFTFSPRTPPWLLQALRTKQVWGGPPRRMFLPSVRRLAILGGSEAFVADIVGSCGGLDTLEVDFPVEFGPECRKPHLVTLRKNGETQAGTNIYVTKLPVDEPSHGTPSTVWEGVLVDDVAGVRRFSRLP